MQFKINLNEILGDDELLNRLPNIISVQQHQSQSKRDERLPPWYNAFIRIIQSNGEYIPGVLTLGSTVGKQH